MIRVILFGAMLNAAAAGASAQSVFEGPALRSTLPDDGEAADRPRPVDEPPSRLCGSRDALFASGNQKIWVTRVGTARWHNPLRPMAPEPLQIVQVAVNGRAGSAFGPDFDNLRQGDAAASLDGVEAVRWASALGEVPAEIRVVADDGRVLVGPLAFVTCGEAPKVTRAATRTEKRRPADDVEPTDRGEAPVPRETSRPSRRDAPPRAPALPIPQGAIR